MKMNLFENINRTFNGPLTREISHYDYLRTSVRPEISELCNTLENWFGNFNGDRSEFLGRFRNKDEKQHSGAYFELFVFEYFRRLNYNVKFGRPDIQVIKNEQTKFYIECTLSPRSDFSQGQLDHIERIKEGIKTVQPNNRSILFKILKYGHQSPPTKKINSFLKTKLANQFSVPKDQEVLHFSSQGWKFEFVLYPIDEPKIETPPVINCFTSFLEIDPIKKLLLSLSKKKASKYSKKSIPYIIAINSDDMYLGENEIEEALFGRVMLRMDTGELVRDSRGFWVDKNRPINTHISGIIISKGLRPLDWPTKFELWHNPYAKNPLSNSLIPIDQIEYLRNDGRYLNKVETRGTLYTEIMGLSDIKW
ncbi:MAG: hypothetical protein R3D00_23985 [Bacteroidia bacterium]